MPKQKQKQRHHFLTSTTLALLSLLTTTPTVQSRKHLAKDSFPTNDEYDSQLFDPQHIFGAPLGGYSRATRSRLANLPIRLVGGASFDLDMSHLKLSADTKKKEEQNEEEKEGKEKEEEKKEEEVPRATSKSPYFTIRDGSGNPFACRVYHEDELDPRSITASMFDAPVFRDHTKPPPQKPKVWISNSATDGSLDTTEKVYNAVMERMKSSPPPMNEYDAVTERIMKSSSSSSNDNTAKPEKSKPPSYQPIPKKLVKIHPIDIKHQLSKLQGLCSQSHQGWWSYEWCFGRTMTQFHVSITAGKQQTSTGGNSRRVQTMQIEDMTNLGNFHGQAVLLTDSPGKNAPPPKVPPGAVKTGSILIREQFIDGDVCQEAGIRRSTTVELSCCTKMNVNQMYKSAGKSPPTADENYHVSIEQMVMDGVPLAALLSVKEDKNDICVYTAKACSPLLCADQFHPVEEEDYSLFEDEVVDVKPAIDVGRSDGGASSSTANQGGMKSGAINVGKNEESNIEVGRSDGGASASSKPPIDVGRSDSVTSSSSEYHTAGGRNERSNIFGRTKGASKDASSAQKGVAINSIPEKKEVDLIVMPDDSIRTILKKTLGKKCLLRNNGW
uniref:Protein OS9-like domain-containing protein n=1 Tax=Ditylum brightwellii TaxID=49249 RepID=A0A7S4RH86_9STRA